MPAHKEERAAYDAALPHGLQQASRFRGLCGDAVELRFDRTAESLS
jgi:hypothetical protein